MKRFPQPSHFPAPELGIREAFEIPEPINDVGGRVPRFNVPDIPVAVTPHLAPDPIRYSDFDPNRTTRPLAVYFSPNFLNPRIVGEFLFGKQMFEPGVGLPRGSQLGSWDWDSTRRNRARPVTRSFGTEAPSDPLQPETNLSYWP